ncbi:nucleotidyltransferase domain-containing protein [methanogenic archaeon mixed culture ISO4-G1]|nr:nucleotidyltransferase domain-containing protein [methanogenic archaeon mixed culture ISO4-G1]
MSVHPSINRRVQMSKKDGNSSNITLDELKDIVRPIAIRYNIKRIFLFGSRARGDNDEDSDYDFIILCPDDMGLIGLTNFRNELIKALDKPVDFAYEDYLTSGFNSIVGQDKVLVYES